MWSASWSQYLSTGIAVCSALSWLGRLVAAETRVRSQASKCHICDGQIVTGTVFSKYFCFFPASIITAVLDTDFELHVHLIRRTDGRTEVGNLPRRNAFSEIYKALNFSRVSVFR